MYKRQSVLCTDYHRVWYDLIRYNFLFTLVFLSMLSKCSPVQNENMAEEGESYPLHECVFSGDVRKLSALIRTHDVAKRDKHGMLSNSLKLTLDI